MGNKKYACIALDLESDHSGRLPEQYDSWQMVYKVLLDIFPLPSTIVFDFHLHDLQTVKPVQLLSPFWRYIYRKKQGNQLVLLEKILLYLQEKNYTFVPICTLALHK